MVTKELVSEWRANVLGRMREDDLDAEVQEPYKPDNLAAGSADLDALRLLEARMQEDGFGSLALEHGAWYSVYGGIQIRVFVQHKGTTIVFTSVAKGSGAQGNIEVAEYTVDLGPSGVATIERHTFDVASLVLPKHA